MRSRCLLLLCNMQQVAPDSAFNNAQPDELKAPNPASQAPTEAPAQTTTEAPAQRIAGVDIGAAANAAKGIVNSLQKSGALNSFLETESNNLRINSKDGIRRRPQLRRQLSKQGIQ